jgi:MYXO-CTERM domain-containing protein
MFFVISKLVGFATTPSNAMAILGLLGLLLLLLRRRKAGTSLLALSTVLILICGLTPVSALVVSILENRFPQPELTEAPTGVITLGGPIDVDLSPARHTVAMSGAAERITDTAVMAVRYPKARIVLSGGTGRFADPGENTESGLTKKLLVEFGIPADRIEVEDKSRTTAENAALTLAMLKPKPGERWLLVTSASHMPRAVGAFRAVGFDVIPYPVDYHTMGPGYPLGFPNSLSGGLSELDLGVHEWIGLLGYWLSGRSNALFPHP